MIYSLIYGIFLLLCVEASQNVFSVTDDLFAYPQFEIDFSTSYILEDDAQDILQASHAQNRQSASATEIDSSVDHDVDYKHMLLQDRRFLCSIPHVRPFANVTKEEMSEEAQKKQLIQAADRGWQLLSDMEGKQCLYYSTGWWSYAFCYNSHVKQFHSLPPSSSGARNWPPQEDQSSPSYILGEYKTKSASLDSSNAKSDHKNTQVQTRADGNYLVQMLEGGTPCDLTGKNRKVEIEFHCHPQTTDRIGWIKETTTCTYLMVIYTPRLCNDVAFQPPRDSQAHAISCREILTLSEAARLGEDAHQVAFIDQSDEKQIIGNIEIGAMKFIGKDGKKIERGRVAMTAEEKAEVIIMKKDGQIQGLSRTKLKELNLKPEEIEQFKKQLQKIAGSNDWKVERLVDETGQIILQGIVSADDDDDDKDDKSSGDNKSDKTDAEKDDAGERDQN